MVTRTPTVMPTEPGPRHDLRHHGDAEVRDDGGTLVDLAVNVRADTPPAWLKDRGRDYGLAAAEAKLFASEVSSRATNAGIQIHGGYGYVEEYKVERFLRDAKLTEIGEGTSQVQRLVIARKILGLRVV